MCKIIAVTGREILDSRGNPTIEAEVILQCGTRARASVPSGASRGSREACELRDSTKKRYGGLGVRQAVKNISEKIAPALIGMNSFDQNAVDGKMLELDGSKNKKNLGANAILAVSLACARASADALGIELFRYIGGIAAVKMPVPMMNLLNGGMHSDAPLDFQEFMIRPVGAEKFSDALLWGSEIFRALKAILTKRGLSTAVGDEGGFAPALASHEDALATLMKAVESTTLKPGKDVTFALDCAASEFYSNKTNLYEYRKSNKKMTCDSQKQAEYLEKLVNSFPIDSIEDPMAEDDIEGWINITAALGNKVQLVADDLTVTDSGTLEKMIAHKAGNAILIKPNQTGTLSETLKCIQTAKDANWNTVISHRSGETADTFIADLAAGTNAGQIKTGSLSRSERVEKYNRLLEIESLMK